MKNLINQLELMGQSASLNQFSSLREMLNEFNVDHENMAKLLRKGHDLICVLEPGDDEDEDVV